ncbi:MAG: ATP-binding protein [bacterium]|nr:ATP-binding protein [bacterium]
MKKDVIKRIIRDFHQSALPELKHRQLEVPQGTGKIITIVGARRSGKTCFLYQLMKKLLTETCNKTHLLYINFEDERMDLEKEDLDIILQSYRELYPDVKMGNVHLFFDEIQNVQGWDRFVRRIDDTVTKNIYITGSNSKLLSKEIATSLRGRSLTYEMFPLDFKEYLHFSGIEADYISSKGGAAVRNGFDRFLRAGGFPESVGVDDTLRVKILQDYYNTMLFRDMVERYEIKQVHILKYFLKRLFASVTKDISVNKIYNELKSQGLKVGKNVLYEFLEAIENIYLMVILKKYAASIVKQELSEKKVYCIDNGLINAVTFRFSEDTGKLLENLIAVELLKKGKNLFFYRENVECDFIVMEKDEVCSAIQVSLSLVDPDTRHREFRGLAAACRRFGLPGGYLITLDEEERIVEEGIEIKVVPAFKYLLENN